MPLLVQIRSSMVKYGQRAELLEACAEVGHEQGSPHAPDVRRATALVKAADAPGHEQGLHGSPPHQNLPAVAHNVRRATVLMKAAEHWAGHSLELEQPGGLVRVASSTSSVRAPRGSRAQRRLECCVCGGLLRQPRAWCIYGAVA